MGQRVERHSDRVDVLEIIFSKHVEDVPFLRERNGTFGTVARDLDAKKVVCLAEIRDQKVFHKLPLKLGNFID